MRPSHDPWKIAEAVLGISRRVLLRGKPGTGKTYAASKLGLADGQKVYQITMTPETPMAEIRGHFIQQGGDFLWHDGPAVAAWREGARLVINEIDRASEDVHSLLFVIMDDPEFAELTLPTGETVRPAENFGLVATMNGVPEDLPDALQDRLPVDIEITDLAQGALDRLPDDLKGPAKNTALAKSEERSISIRMWMEFASLREKLSNQEDGTKTAAYAVFGDKAEAALDALTIGSNASPPINMEGNILSEISLQLLKEYFIWAEEYRTSRDMSTLVADTIYREASSTGNRLLLEPDVSNYDIPDVTNIVDGELWINVDGIQFIPAHFEL